MLFALRLRVLTGGRKAEPLEQMLEALLPKARRWVVRELGPELDPDDALQDALTEVARAYTRFRDESDFTTYAYRIVVRVARRHRRRLRRHRFLEVAPPPVDHVDPESTAMSRQALRRLYRALDRLPEKRRQAFILCAIEGLEAGDAAELEGTNATAMRSRLRHARRELARLLAHDAYLRALMERS